MKPIEVIELKKTHLARLANQQGAAGESILLEEMENWIPRPRGNGLKVLLETLKNLGINIRGSSFDAIALPQNQEIDFDNSEIVKKVASYMVFIEIKTANQKRVKDDFSGFFFALTESEISASEQLGNRHKVALYNKRTGNILMTSIPEIIEKAKSTNWQVSVQL
ncbi:hypothetical protein KJ966_22785 [bacterium]|nr:hypothetical protein [bacterium]